MYAIHIVEKNHVSRNSPHILVLLFTSLKVRAVSLSDSAKSSKWCPFTNAPTFMFMVTQQVCIFIATYTKMRTYIGG